LTTGDTESHYQYQFEMILCLCKGVSERAVRLVIDRLVIAHGATSVDAVGMRCGAGTDCRSCRHAIKDMIDDAQAVPMACDGCEGSAANASAASRSHVAVIP
jgi:bacterioferritin-associated ferredoxin